MRRGLTIGLAFLAAAGAAHAEQPLSRSQPSHMSPVPPGGYELPMAPPLTRFPMRPQAVVLNSLTGWRDVGRIDPALSQACGERRFTERFAMQFRAIFEKKDVLGVAFGNGANLNDSGKLAQADKIYLFRNGDSSACTVVELSPEELTALQSGAALSKRGTQPGARPKPKGN
jgi:hypothetical protein